MRWLVLMGLLTVSCLPPQSEPLDPVPEIFLDFPELAQWGQVVFIGGREYWRPDRAHFVLVPPIRRAAPPHDAWMPYGNGYFYDDALDGLVWVSSDPWGFITTHHGYWRHHEQLGYVWRPLYPLAWRPFVATILRDERGFLFGMCPFSRIVWETGLYDLGFGFDDAYWAPYWSNVDTDGFYAHHRPRFDGYWVSVTFYEAEQHWRDVPDPHFQRDRDERERRRHPGSRADDPPSDRERQRRDDPSESRNVGAGLPARPGATPPTPERGGDDRSPPAPAGLPTIPRRDLDPKRERAAEENPPRLPLESGDLRPVETRRPSTPSTAPVVPGAAPAVPDTPPTVPRITPRAVPGPVAARERQVAPAAETKRTAQDSEEPKRDAPPQVELDGKGDATVSKKPPADKAPPRETGDEKQESSKRTKVKQESKRSESAARVRKAVDARQKKEK